MATIENTYLRELSALRESENHVEFKAARHNYPFNGGKRIEPKERRRCVLGYVVALANEKGDRLLSSAIDSMCRYQVSKACPIGSYGTGLKR